MTLDVWMHARLTERFTFLFQAIQAAAQRTQATTPLQVDATMYHQQTLTIGSRHKKSVFKKVSDMKDQKYLFFELC